MIIYILYSFNGHKLSMVVTSLLKLFFLVLSCNSFQWLLNCLHKNISVTEDQKSSLKERKKYVSGLLHIAFDTVEKTTNLT